MKRFSWSADLYDSTSAPKLDHTQVCSGKADRVFTKTHNFSNSLNILIKRKKTQKKTMRKRNEKPSVRVVACFTVLHLYW